ncbi:capsule biosynthesis protein [Paracoccus caeni]|uniref:Capsule biosynthesis protein n=1 Tax=Paracoccus caeni TaxID=657651 RepID=A0A934SEE9_9RHOB|nr:capsule biosynthesis protein [Paracoccus caeni]MBK4217371.1 capsule biosynthesis protein [Paracoccus caeni]
MTTPPKARRFHASAEEAVRPGAVSEPVSAQDRPRPDAGIRLELRKKAEPQDVGGVMSDADAQRERLMRTEPVDDGLGGLRAAADEAAGGTTPATSPESPQELEAKLAAIRAENLSERQLRIARRIAAMHQITVNSDEEAVLRLRERGIDPSQRAALGQILSSEGSRAQAQPSQTSPVVVPRTAPPPVPAVAPGTEVALPRPGLPTREALTEEKRAEEIYRIQRDIARRRRRRMAMLSMRLLIFVMLPTFLCGLYYFRYATPLYATVSQFQIQFADTAGMATQGNALAGLQANSDAVGVQSYLSSRDAMLRLDADKGFKAAFQQQDIDPIKRLPADATNEATYRLYQNSVKIGYDPTEGMLDMEVVAPNPQLSQEFSLALIAYAEEQVDRLTARLRSDQMQGAIDVYNDAEQKVVAAQQRVQELQQSLGVLDPVAEGTVVMNQISMLEGQLSEKRLELGQLLVNARPQQSRVDGVRGDISRLEELIAQTRTQLTQGNETRNSLAAITGKLRIAESDLLTRQELLAAAAAQMETARIEANKQVRYLSLSINPVAPDEATYPKAFQNTLVAFLIFSGIYLMLSLTASILREQVST